MKKRFISVILSISILIGVIVIPGAINASGDDLSPFVLLNRDFEDNTSLTNGFSDTQVAGNTITLKKDESTGNTYMHWVADSTSASTTHGHFNINISSYLPDSGSVVVKLKVRTADVSSTGRDLLMVRPYDYHHGSGIFKPDGDAYGYNSSMQALLGMGKTTSGGKEVGAIRSFRRGSYYQASDFVEAAYVFTWTDKTNVTAHFFINGNATEIDSVGMPSYGIDERPCYFRFQVSGGTGLSWDLDDLQIYTTTTTDASLAVSIDAGGQNKGALYNHFVGGYVDPAFLEGHYFFKVNSDRALDKDGKTVYKLTDAPFADDEGVIWFPISSLIKVIGSVNLAAITTVDGRACVRYSDIPNALTGYYPSYNSCGLIAISDKENVFPSGLDTEILIPTMQKFLFDHVDSSLKKVNAFDVQEGQYVSHPYLFANQAKFDEMHAVYTGTAEEIDEVYKNYITKSVSSGINVYKSYAVEVGGAYSSLNTSKGLSGGQTDLGHMPNQKDNGYDIGGRHGQATSHASNIYQLAYAYQITREEKYARLAYDYAIALGNWEHWGPGHFLNCADAAAPYSIAYDWLYTVWTELGLDTAPIARAIFTNAVIPGYYSATADTIPEGWMRCISGVLTRSGWNYNTRNNNWNAVCAAGMVIASLAIVGDTSSTLDVYVDTAVNDVAHERSMHITEIGDHTGLSTYQDYALFIINQSIYGLEIYGLEQYVPDGSYIESNGYWSYGTNNLFKLIAALTTATEYNTGVADDFGLFDTWGMDRTCYFAINTQSGDYKGWNYHDSGSTGAQDTSWFEFVGNFTGDTDIAEIRKIALASGKSGSPTIQDALFYKKSSGEYKKPELQYWMEGINGYVVRDSWESGSIFAGMLGDTNNLGHGQIDSGSFVYHNGGTIWFCDLGTENYNCYGFWGGATRYRYYKMSAEGNNTLFLADRHAVPYGQALNGFGAMIETGSNDYGAYSIIDNTSVYGGYARSAYRGMLLTNDRRTLVIQDEAEFYSPEKLYWVGHTQQNVVLSVDGTVAYMTDGKTVIKVTIIDKNNSGARFEIEDAYTFHLEASEGMDELAKLYYEAGTHESNHDRSGYKKLTIALDNVTSVKLAVVIEEVAVGEISRLGYDWQPISEWDERTPSSDGSVPLELVAKFDADTEAVGRLDVSLGSLNMTTGVVGGSLAYIIDFSEKSGGFEGTFKAKESLSEYGYLGDRTIVAELDISAYSSIPQGARLSLSSVGGELVGVDLSDVGVISEGQFARITFVVDGKSDLYYIFLGDTLVEKGIFVPMSCEDIGIRLSSGAGVTGEGSLILDNLTLRVFGSDYTDIDAALEEEDITKWKDRTVASGSSATPLATLRIKVGASDMSADSPIVDYVGVPAYRDPKYPEYLNIDIYEWNSLSALLEEGMVISLHASNTYSPITIGCPVTVETNGHNLRAIAPNHIARVDGDNLIYEKGEITVTWVTDSGSFTEVYTGSVPAVYKGVALPGIIRERKTDYGYGYYVRDGWTTTVGGASVTEEEMIVTDKNNIFYQADREYDGAFVTVKGGVITGYDDPEQFFSVAMRNVYDRVSLVSDITHDSTGRNDGKGASSMTLYLNGHKLHYASSDTSDHMIYTTNLKIYGPGVMESSAGSSNLFYLESGTGLIENVTFYSPRTLCDHRGGVIEFRGCDIYITKDGSAFAVNNRNNKHTNVSMLPTVRVVDCYIELQASKSSSAVFSMHLNSVMEILDTEIKSVSDCYLFSLNNSTIGTVENFDYNNSYRYMQVKLGNLTHSCTKLAKTASNDPSGNKHTEMIKKIGYTEGALLSEYTDTELIFDGCAVVRGGDEFYPYEVVKPENAVSVSWRVEDRNVTELWKKGVVPTPTSDAVKELISNIPSGQRYSFATHELTEDAVFIGSPVSDIPVSVNLTLHSGFTLNVYFKLLDGITYKEFIVDGIPTFAQEVTIDGVEYMKISVNKNNPSTAGEEIEVTVLYSDKNTGAENTRSSTQISIAEYAELLLGDEKYSRESKMLMANVIKYIEAAYVYAGRTSDGAYRAIKSLRDSYSGLITVSAVERSEAELEGVCGAITGAALYLTENPNFRFYLSDSFNGSVRLSYTSLDKRSDGGYEVVSLYTPGDVRTDKDGLRFIELNMKAYDFTEVLTVSVEIDGKIAETTYSLAQYYHAVAKAQDEVMNLVNAIYAYAECARVYKLYSLENGLN